MARTSTRWGTQSSRRTRKCVCDRDLTFLNLECGLHTHRHRCFLQSLTRRPSLAHHYRLGVIGQMDGNIGQDFAWRPWVQVGVFIRTIQ